MCNVVSGPEEQLRLDLFAHKIKHVFENMIGKITVVVTPDASAVARVTGSAIHFSATERSATLSVHSRGIQKI